MNLLLTMMLSSNILFLLYLTARFLFKDYFSACWKSNLLKLSLVLSLIPVAVIRPIASFLLRHYFGVSLSADLSFTISGTEELLIIAPKGVEVTSPLRIELIVFTVWLVIGILSLCFYTFRYLARKKSVSASMQLMLEPEAAELLSQYKQVLKIRRSIKLYTCQADISPFTIGILKPMIIIPSNLPADQHKLDLVLHHELCHIKNFDNLYTFIRILSVSLYWFNPLCHLLNKYSETESEMACDDAVIQSLSGSRKKEYGNLIIDIASACQTDTGIFATAFCLNTDRRGNKILKERILHMIKKRKQTKKKKFLSMALAGVMIICSSIPVFAYRAPGIYDFSDDDGSPVAISDDATIVFTPDGAVNPYAPPVILYDNQFTDLNGKIYDLGANPDSGMPYANCKHNYVSGQSSNHIRKSDGSCVTKFYNSKRCTKCGKVLKGPLISTVQFDPCPHH